VVARREERQKELSELREKIEAGRDPKNLARYMELVEKQLSEVQSGVDELQAAAEEINVVFVEGSVEGSKLRSEALKHQATIAGGAIVGIATITQVVMPPNLNATLLLWATYVVLLMMVCYSIILMHAEARRTEDLLRTGESNVGGRVARWTYVASYMGLPVAVVLFIIFQLCNGLL
jgi:hypothetical protein